MPNNGNTDYKDVAGLTIELVNHSYAPDRITDAILETLIEMGHELNINIWLFGYGLSLDGLTRLYSQQSDIGSGQRRARLYGDYEIQRRK